MSALWIETLPEVQEAISAGRPVVALESTVITHGLPRPINWELARSLEAEVRAIGAVPATTAVMNGQVHLGLTSDQLEQLAVDDSAVKIASRDVGPARVAGRTGGTTVSATMVIAAAAGVEVLATGGIGGIHRGESGDVSADLVQLADTPMTVVCAGAKSILDLPRTLEHLETTRVPVIGYQTDEFPAFYARSSGLPISARVDSASEAARMARAHWDTGLRSAMLICVPCPEGEALTWEEADAAVTAVQSELEASDLRGQAVTPWMLTRLAELTDGGSLRANLALLRNNASVAAELARAL